LRDPRSMIRGVPSKFRLRCRSATASSPTTRSLGWSSKRSCSRSTFTHKEEAMRKTIAMAMGVLIMAALTVSAQEKAKTDKAEPKAKSGHEMTTKKGGGGSDAATIARAMSAGPPSVSRNATIMTMTDDGKMTQLRAGTNGWMCLVEADGTPMCLDKEWQAW